MHKYGTYLTHVYQAQFGGEAACPQASDAWRPPANLYERDEDFVAVVELPGVPKEDIEVTIEDRILTITGRRTESAPENAQRVLQLEIPYGRYERHIRLPARTDVEEIQAEYRDGYLRITIPKGSAS
jgi:HSP20 family protein